MRIPKGDEFTQNPPQHSPEVFLGGLLCSECKVRDINIYFTCGQGRQALKASEMLFNQTLQTNIGQEANDSEHRTH